MTTNAPGAAPPWDLGDVVRLKSGGPNMTVIGRLSNRAEDSVSVCRCVYFTDGKLGEVLLPEVALLPVYGTPQGDHGTPASPSYDVASTHSNG